MTIQERPEAPSASAAEPACPEHDRELVEAFRAGDVDAFSIIADEHYDVLRYLARQILGHGTQAEDAVQETFERALKGLKRFGSNGDYLLRPWLCRILRNVCADHRLRASRSLRLYGSAMVEAEHEQDVADKVGDPQTQEIVRQAVWSLPGTHRRALILHELEGLAYSEVAAVEDISIENARARVSRSKSTLRRRLRALRGIVLVPGLPLGTRLARLVTRSEAPPRGATMVKANGASSYVGQIIGRIGGSPLGQSAFALVASPPRGAFVFGLAATMATVSATSVLAVTPSPSSPRVVATALSADTRLAAPLAPSTTTTTVPAAGSEVSHGAANASQYSWVNPPGSGAAASLAALSPALSCISSDGVAAPGPNFGFGTPLGLDDAVLVGNAPTTTLSTAGPNPTFATPLSVAPYGQPASSGQTLMATVSTCLSPQGWLTAQITNPSVPDEVMGELTGTVVNVLGSPGDLGYVFRGTLQYPGTSGSSLVGTQFVAQLMVAEPDNTAAMTVVFLSPLGGLLPPQTSTGAASSGPSAEPSSQPSSPPSSSGQGGQGAPYTGLLLQSGASARTLPASPTSGVVTLHNGS
ncbi:MAG: sigma-70 family RNA polymerase sigma factor [Acidimicrobiales bacterium]